MPEQEEELLRTNVKRFRGGLVFKAHRLVYHSTLGWRVIKKKEKKKNPKPQSIKQVFMPGQEEVEATCFLLQAPPPQRETSLLTSYWSESTLSSR